MNKLHDKLGVAYLEIHLENICFKEESDGNISAVLIDLDQCASVSKYSDFTYSQSCMYQVPEGQRFTRRLDAVSQVLQECLRQ